MMLINVHTTRANQLADDVLHNVNQRNLDVHMIGIAKNGNRLLVTPKKSVTPVQHSVTDHK
jgi:hypothetical protein